MPTKKKTTNTNETVSNILNKALLFGSAFIPVTAPVVAYMQHRADEANRETARQRARLQSEVVSGASAKKRQQNVQRTQALKSNIRSTRRVPTPAEMNNLRTQYGNRPVLQEEGLQNPMFDPLVLAASGGRAFAEPLIEYPLNMGIQAAMKGAGPLATTLANAGRSIVTKGLGTSIRNGLESWLIPEVRQLGRGISTELGDVLSARMRPTLANTRGYTSPALRRVDMTGDTPLIADPNDIADITRLLQNVQQSQQRLAQNTSAIQARQAAIQQRQANLAAGTITPPPSSATTAAAVNAAVNSTPSLTRVPSKDLVVRFNGEDVVIPYTEDKNYDVFKKIVDAYNARYKGDDAIIDWGNRRMTYDSSTGLIRPATQAELTQSYRSGIPGMNMLSDRMDIIANDLGLDVTDPAVEEVLTDFKMALRTPEASALRKIRSRQSKGFNPTGILSDKLNEQSYAKAREQVAREIEPTATIEPDLFGNGQNIYVRSGRNEVPIDVAGTGKKEISHASFFDPNADPGAALTRAWDYLKEGDMITIADGGGNLSGNSLPLYNYYLANKINSGAVGPNFIIRPTRSVGSNRLGTSSYRGVKYKHSGGMQPKDKQRVVKSFEMLQHMYNKAFPNRPITFDPRYFRFDDSDTFTYPGFTVTLRNGGRLRNRYLDNSRGLIYA